MARIGVVGFAMLLMVSHATAAKPVLHHDLLVRLDPSAHRLKGIDRIEDVRAKGEHLIFSLAGHLTINKVTFNGKEAAFRFHDGRLAIPLVKAQTGGRLTIEYEGVYKDAVVHSLNTDNPGYGVTGTIQPQGTLLLAGAGWYPRSLETDATYAVTVDAPQGVLAIVAGNSMGHTTVKGRSLSRWQVDKPLEGLSLAAGPLKRATQSFGTVTAATYFSEPLQHLSQDYLEAVGRYLKFYESRFGPYPFKQFAVVENFFPTGYGFPSFTLMGRRVLQLPFIIHTSLGHEVAHCWWGNGVLVDASRGNWSEGLTTYVADYLFKEQQGAGMAHRRQWLRNYASLVDPSNDMAVSAFLSRMDPITKTVGYDKTAMVFHMLRRMVGEEKFWQTLGKVYTQYRFQAISWDHWQSAFEQAAGGSLKVFFDQWIYRTGAPSLALSNVHVTAAKSGFVIRGQIEQSRPYFDVMMDVDLQTQTQTHRRTLRVSGPRTPFSWQVADLPRQLTLDPDVHLFRRLAPSEIPPTVNTVKGAPNVTVLVARDLDSNWLDVARRLTAAMGIEGAVIGREAQFSDKHLANRDLILIGPPQDKRLLPEKQAGFTLNNEQLTLSGQSFSRDGTSFFGVFGDPGNPRRVVALFLAQSIDQAAVLSAKIPHYGKYSYLVFKGARNRVKGTWPAGASPLTVQWSENDVNQNQRGAL